MRTARKTNAPRTDPAIAPVFDWGAAVVDGEGDVEEVGLWEGAVVDEGDWAFIHDESPDNATVLRKLPPERNWASTCADRQNENSREQNRRLTMRKMICVPLYTLAIQSNCLSVVGFNTKESPPGMTPRTVIGAAAPDSKYPVNG